VESILNESLCGIVSVVGPSRLGDIPKVLTIGKSSTTTSNLKNDEDSYTTDEDDKHGLVENKVAKSTNNRNDSNKKTKTKSKHNDTPNVRNKAFENFKVRQSYSSGKE